MTADRAHEACEGIVDEPCARASMADMDPILTKYVREPNSFTLDFYLQHDGYDGAEEGARRRSRTRSSSWSRRPGCAAAAAPGFPTGMKWQFVDKKVEPRYIACNADESEPGTFKDHLLMERNPHLLIEGCAIGCYAIGAKVAYIYIRGEFFHVQHVLERAIDEAYARGFLGKNILGSGFDCDVYVHRGAGAYEAGEETALLESLEGKRAQPRNKPPFPARRRPLRQADRGQQRRDALQRAADRRERARSGSPALGPEKNGGPKLYCVSGHVQAAGRLRSVDERHAARADRRLRRRRARGPHAQGGHPRRIVGADSDAGSARHAGELRRDPEGRLAARLGGDRRARRHDLHGLAGGEPAALLPPRVVRQVHAVPRRHRLAATRSCSASSAAKGRCGISICSRASRATSPARRCARSATPRSTPVLTTLKHFRHEYEAHIREGRCTLPADWRARHPVGAHCMTPRRHEDTKIAPVLVSCLRAFVADFV